VLCCHSVKCALDNERFTNFRLFVAMVLIQLFIVFGCICIPITSSQSCSSFDAPLVLAPGIDVHDTSIAIGSDGFPIISYFDNSNLNLGILHCRSPDCVSHDNPIFPVPRTTNTIGSFPSIAVGTDGFPIISSRDSTGNALVVVHCTAVDCSSVSLPIIADAVGRTGYLSSIAIGTDNYPIISYYDSSTWDLTVHHCTNETCLSGDSQVLDRTDINDHTSMAIGIDGFPIMSYYHSLDRDLMVISSPGY